MRAVHARVLSCGQLPLLPFLRFSPASSRRYPDEIAERAKAAAAKLAAARQEKAQQQRAEMQSRMERYFQPFSYGL